jgi:hypothetical protein
MQGMSAEKADDIVCERIKGNWVPKVVALQLANDLLPPDLANDGQLTDRLVKLVDRGAQPSPPNVPLQFFIVDLGKPFLDLRKLCVRPNHTWRNKQDCTARLPRLSVSCSRTS